MGPLGSYMFIWWQLALIICMKMIEHEHTKCTVVVRQRPKTSGWGIQIQVWNFRKSEAWEKKLCSRDAAIGTTLYPPRTSNITPTQQFLRCPLCGSVYWLLTPECRSLDPRGPQHPQTTINHPAPSRHLQQPKSMCSAAFDSHVFEQRPQLVLVFEFSLEPTARPKCIQRTGVQR